MTNIALILFNTRVGASMLCQILMAVKRFSTIATFKWPLTFVMSLHVSGQRVFRCEVFDTVRTFVWPANQ